MVYTPKVWNNEVITDTALNHIENGIAAAETWSNEIIDANKDMQGYDQTNIGRLQVNSVFDTDANGIACPSQTLQYSKDAEGSYVAPSTTAYSSAISITLGAGHVTSKNGFLIAFDAKALVGGQDVYVQLVANDVILDETLYTTTTYITKKKYGLALQSGDVIALNVKSSGSTGHSATIRNFRLYADYVLNSVGVDSGTFS